MENTIKYNRFLLINLLCFLLSGTALFAQPPADMMYDPNGSLLEQLQTNFVPQISGVTLDGDEYAAAFSVDELKQVGAPLLITSPDGTSPDYRFLGLSVNGEYDCSLFPSFCSFKATEVIACPGGDCGSFFFILYDPDGNSNAGAYYVLSSVTNVLSYDFDNRGPDPLDDQHAELLGAGTLTVLTGENEPFASIAAIFAALPVTYLSFTAALRSGDVHLDWSTATELDNDHFLVERSGDGRTFTPIGKVKGAGTTELVQKYSYVDTEPFPGPNYYRLKQIDFDGAFEYSAIISVNFNAKGETAVRIQPNPATDRVSIGLDGSWREEATDVHLSDLAGKRVGGLLSQSPGMINLPIAELVPGVYLLQVTDGRNVRTERLVIRQ